MRSKNKVNKGDRISPNERGIPIDFMKKELEKLGLKILSIRKAYYAPLMRTLSMLKFLQKFPILIYHIDNVCSNYLPPFNPKYYRETYISKFAPGSAYYIAEKIK